MIIIKCQEHYDKAQAYAKLVGKEENLRERLEQLEKLGDIVELYKDFSTHSFLFVAKNNDGTRAFNGGLIYHGFSHHTTLCVSLTDTDGWSIHT